MEDYFFECDKTGDSTCIVTIFFDSTYETESPEMGYVIACILSKMSKKYKQGWFTHKQVGPCEVEITIGGLYDGVNNPEQIEKDFAKLFAKEYLKLEHYRAEVASQLEEWCDQIYKIRNAKGYHTPEYIIEDALENWFNFSIAIESFFDETLSPILPNGEINPEAFNH